MSIYNLPEPVALPKTLSNISKTLWYKLYQHFPNATVTVNGVELKASNFRMLERCFITNEYEPEDFRIVRQIMSTGGVFIDVGANIGLYSIWARNCGADLVYAIEPSIREVYSLIENIALHETKQIQVVSRVAWSRSGQIIQLLIAEDFQRGSNAIGHFYYSGTKKKTSERCVTVTIDDFEVESVKLIKIDTDGSEYQVVKGCKETIEKFHPTFLIEAPPDALVRYLESLDYQHYQNPGMYNVVFEYVD